MTEALGTAFVVSQTKVLTACHVMKKGAYYDLEAILVRSLERRVNGVVQLQFLRQL